MVVSAGEEASKDAWTFSNCINFYSGTATTIKEWRLVIALARKAIPMHKKAANLLGKEGKSRVLHLDMVDNLRRNIELWLKRIPKK